MQRAHISSISYRLKSFSQDICLLRWLRVAKQVFWTLVWTLECEAWVCSSMVENLPHLYEALTSITHTRKMTSSRVLVHLWDFHDVTSLSVRKFSARLGRWCVAVSAWACAFVDIRFLSFSSDWVVKVSLPSLPSWVLLVVLYSGSLSSRSNLSALLSVSTLWVIMDHKL